MSIIVVVDFTWPKSEALRLYLGLLWVFRAAKLGICLEDMSICPSLVYLALNLVFRSSSLASIYAFSVKHSLIEDTILPNKDCDYTMPSHVELTQHSFLLPASSR